MALVRPAQDMKDSLGEPTSKKKEKKKESYIDGMVTQFASFTDIKISLKMKYWVTAFQEIGRGVKSWVLIGQVRKSMTQWLADNEMHIKVTLSPGSWSEKVMSSCPYG